MCGIVGYAGKTNVIKNIMTGLKSLEYRGYDSSGIAYLDKNNNIKIYKKDRHFRKSSLFKFKNAHSRKIC